MALTTQRENVYWIERDSIAIAKLDSSEDIDNRFTGPEASKTITLFVTRYDDEFIEADSGSGQIGMDDSPSIPEEFHDALVFKAVQKGYELKLGKDPKLFNVAAYWRAGYDKLVKEGLQYANNERISSGRYHIVQHEF